VIPVYNRDTLFWNCLQSVLAQTFDSLNIFVIEDGSRLAIRYLDPFFKNHVKNSRKDGLRKKITYVCLETNHGVSYCRNLGASLGRGKYIAFLDSDDRWAPDKISRQVDFLEKNRQYQWIHTNEVWQKDGQVIKQKKEHTKQGGIFLERQFERCLISPSAVMFERTFFENQGWFLPHFRVAEDYELWLRLNVQNPIAYLEEPLTIKQAGDWEQLSRTPEIDKWRVLALHRLYRTHKKDPEFARFLVPLKKELLKKIQILVKGAEKYHHPVKQKQYLLWLQMAENLPVD